MSEELREGLRVVWTPLSRAGVGRRRTDFGTVTAVEKRVFWVLWDGGGDECDYSRRYFGEYISAYVPAEERTGVGSLELTPEEARAIKSLKRLASRWPKTLWLYSASGSLTVMRTGPDGEHAITPSGGVDQDFVVDVIHGIDNDGGDW